MKGGRFFMGLLKPENLTAIDMADTYVSSALPTITLDDYISTMYEDDCGYIAVAKKERGKFTQTSVPLDLLAYYLDMEGTCYLSINTFFRPSRAKRNVRHLNAFFLDIDCLKIGVSKEDALRAIQHEVKRETVPEPTCIIDSGNGFYAAWKIESAPGKFPKVTRLYEHIQRYLYDIFKDIGADAQALDVSRVLRVPGSKTKADKRVQIVTFNPQATYTMRIMQEYLNFDGQYEEMLADNERRRKDKLAQHTKRNIKHLYNVYTLNTARARDFEMLCKLRNYDVTGFRDTLIYIYHYWMLLVHQDEKTALYHTLNLNDSFLEPLTEDEVKSYVSSSVKMFRDIQGKSPEELKLQAGVYKMRGYNFSNRKLIELLAITVEEQKHLKTIISKEVKYQRNNERRTPRNEDGLTPREAAKKELVAKVKELHEKGLSNAQIADKLDISLSTVKRCRRAI